MSSTQHEETTPLLRQATNDHEEVIEPVRAVNVKATVTSVTVLIVLAMFANFMSIPAQNVIFEQIICNNYFAATNTSGSSPTPIPPRQGPPVLDNPCKSEPVQSELGYILGWKDTFEVLPTLIVGVPYGMLADRWGRRPVLFMALFGVTIAESAARVVCHWPQIFPLRGVWYANAFNLLGGGARVASSMIYTVIADIILPEKRADIYVIIQASVLIAESIGTPLGATLAERANPWIPYMATPIGLVLSTLWVFFIPETKPHRVILEPEQRQPPWSKDRIQKAFTSMEPQRWPRAFGRRVYKTVNALWQNFSLVCLVVVFFTALVRGQAANFLVLYASKKFHWPLSRASNLFALRSATNLILLLLIIPSVTHWLLRFLSAARKDLALLRAQGALLTIGAVGIALAGSPAVLVTAIIVFGLGAGFDVNLRSLATSLVQRTHFATLNSALAFFEGAGMMTAGPLLASAWHRGLVLGGPWLGLPFIVAALIFGAALLVTIFVRVDDAEQEAVEQVEEQEGVNMLDEEGVI